jgi:hypothetical protein
MQWFQCRWQCFLPSQETLYNWIFRFRWMNLTQLHNMKKRYWSEDPERRITHGGVRSMFLFCRKSPPTIFSILHMHVTMFLFGWYFILLQRKDLLEISPSSSNFVVVELPFWMILVGYPAW